MSKQETQTLRVELGERSYNIHIGAGLIARAGELIKPVLRQDVKVPRVVVVSDRNVAPIYMSKLLRSLKKAGIKTDKIVLPAGEQTKDFKYLQRLLDKLLGLRIERRTTLIALGGGVIGDLVGFAAAIALRGIDFIQIPTTLLSQVDSSVGGKTAIDTRHGKNLVGAFHQPRLVLADIDALDTLPEREIHAGYAEIAKYGLINDPGFWSWLESGAGKQLIDGDKAIRTKAVYESCANKARVVSGDERETEGVRALLNLGHTFGHALEAETGFGGLLLHGEAVAMGCVMAFALSARLGLCPQGDADRVRRHYASIGLRTDPSQIQLNHWDSETLIRHMGNDKKVEDGSITFILARGIGQAFIAKNIATAEVRAVLDRAIAA
jgi:3-dehydroquinate synthase